MFTALPIVIAGGALSALALVAGPGDGALAAGEPSCAVFPANNPWNADISAYPVHPQSDAFVNSIGRTDHLHPDFGTVWNGAPIGIPYVIVPGSQPKVPVSFDYADESDTGPYPVPPDAPIEGGPNSGGDRHVLVIDNDNCVLTAATGTSPARPIPAGATTASATSRPFRATALRSWRRMGPRLRHLRRRRQRRSRSTPQSRRSRHQRSQRHYRRSRAHLRRRQAKPSGHRLLRPSSLRRTRRVREGDCRHWQLGWRARVSSLWEPAQLEAGTTGTGSAVGCNNRDPSSRLGARM